MCSAKRYIEEEAYENVRSGGECFSKHMENMGKPNFVEERATADMVPGMHSEFLQAPEDVTLWKHLISK